MPTIRHRGSDFAVTKGWHQDFCAPWPGLALFSKEQVDSMRKMLLQASNDRRLTDAELSKLSALDAHFNVRNALDWLGGRPHTDFGFTGADQVHGNLWWPPCGCELHHVFDHHRRDEEGLEVHPHKPRHVCDAHKHLVNDLHALHAQVSKDSYIEPPTAED